MIRSLSRPLNPLSTGFQPLLPQLTGIRAVVFDVYGTLIISGAGDISLARNMNRGEALRGSLQHFGLPTDLADEALAQLFQHEIERVQAERRAQGIEFPEVEIREVWEGFLRQLNQGRERDEGRLDREQLESLAIFYECTVNPVWPMPGAFELIQSLRACGIGLGIVSNAQFFTPLLFEAFGAGLPLDLGFLPDACIYSCELREAKPSTRLYLEALEALRNGFCPDIQPEEILFVGNDRRNDCVPAQMAGFKAALFAGDQRSLRLREGDPFCGNRQPDAVITELLQILHLLKLPGG